MAKSVVLWKIDTGPVIRASRLGATRAFHVPVSTPLPAPSFPATNMLVSQAEPWLASAGAAGSGVTAA